jgi:hypothetical protein
MTDPAGSRTGPETARPPIHPHHHPQTLHTEEIR